MIFCSSGRAAGAVPVTLRVALSLDNYVGGDESLETAIQFDHGAMRNPEGVSHKAKHKSCEGLSG